MDSINCTQCNLTLIKENYSEGAWKSRMWKNKKNGTTFCSSSCKGHYYAKMHSERMTLKNPMMNPDTLLKMKESLKRIGHKPISQGGNGRGMTIPQKMLLQELGEGWFPELVIVTGNGYQPHHYKIDLGFPFKKIAVEVDGGNHCSLTVQKKDKRKEEFLQSKGYKVLRFTNKEILEDVKQIAKVIQTLSTI